MQPEPPPLAAAADASDPGRNGLIVFTSERADKSRELFTMQADGSAQRQLTHAAPLARDPAWSPDGRTIALELSRTTTRRSGSRDRTAR